MNRILALLFAISVVVMLPSCRDKKDEPTPRSVAKRTLLVYAVSSGSDTNGWLKSDEAEMIMSAPKISGLGKDSRVLVYSVSPSPSEEAVLSELKKDNEGQYAFQIVRMYDRNTFSTDPDRMRVVFDDLIDVAPAEKYGLIFWGHATGWLPTFSDHDTSDASAIKKSFGIDIYKGKKDYCDLHELKDALPDWMFDYIWFDCCYMMGIETLYQLQNKCDYIIGSPTEVPGDGMNYNVTLPLLASPNPDLAGASKAFFDYYNNAGSAVSTTVMKTDGLDRLAQAAADIYAAGTRPASALGLQNYSRLKTPLYDFGQYTKRWLNFSDPSAAELEAEFDEALRAITVYAGCSTKNFNGTPNAFDPAKYSGLSCYFPGTATTAIDDYYYTLEWPRDVYR